MMLLEQMGTELEQYLAVKFDEPPHSLGATLERAARREPTKAAILEPGRESLTYADLLALARRTVAALNRLGYSPRSRIALALPSTTAGAAVVLSVITGMMIIPTSPDLPGDEIERFLHHSRADAVIVEHDGAAGAREAAQRIGIGLVEVEFAPAGSVGVFKVLDSEDGAAGEAQFAGPDDGAVVIATSGTTSLPKLVPRTQRQLATLGYLSHDMFYIHEYDYPVFGALPFYHASGLMPLIRSMSRPAGFTCEPITNVGQLWGRLAYYQPAAVMVVPAVLQILVKEAARHAHEGSQLGLKKITVTSAALPEGLMRETERLLGAQVQVLYGMSEMNTIAATRPHGATWEDPPGSAGRPLPFARVIISDEAGNGVAPGMTGEIRVLSPLTFSGYELDQAANDAAFHNGWFRTGDAGHFDADGFLYLTGRFKELINRGGSKISPADVDAVLLQHPGVLEAATFGFPHTSIGEDVAAAIVLRDATLSERELRSFAARRLASHKVPSRFVFVSEIPRTELGKIKRAALTEQFGPQLER